MLGAGHDLIHLGTEIDDDPRVRRSVRGSLAGLMGKVLMPVSPGLSIGPTLPPAHSCWLVLTATSGSHPQGGCLGLLDSKMYLTFESGASERQCGLCPWIQTTSHIEACAVGHMT